jgi:hypothetical protein
MKPAFTNDADNLMLIDKRIARDSEKGPVLWSPPHYAYHCDYIALADDLLDKWKIALKPDEKDLMKNKLAACK